MRLDDYCLMKSYMLVANYLFMDEAVRAPWASRRRAATWRLQ